MTASPSSSRWPAVLAGLLLALPAAAEHAFARFPAVSPPDCVDAGSFVAESDAAPLDRTYMRVQHVGDPGTAELAREVGNAVAWHASGFTGVAASVEAQRGYL